MIMQARHSTPITLMIMNKAMPAAILAPMITVSLSWGLITPPVLDGAEVGKDKVY